MFVMANPPERSETVDALRVETVKLCQVSRSIFEEEWSRALERAVSPQWRLLALNSQRAVASMASDASLPKATAPLAFHHDH